MVVAAMCKKKDQLSQSIEVYKAILETNKQLTTELGGVWCFKYYLWSSPSVMNYTQFICFLFFLGQVHDAASKETQLKLEIKKSGIDVSKLTDVRKHLRNREIVV